MQVETSTEEMRQKDASTTKEFEVKRRWYLLDFLLSRTETSMRSRPNCPCPSLDERQRSPEVRPGQDAVPPSERSGRKGRKGRDEERGRRAHHFCRARTSCANPRCAPS